MGSYLLNSRLPVRVRPGAPETAGQRPSRLLLCLLGGPLAGDAGRVADALVGDLVEGDRAAVQQPQHGQAQPEQSDQGRKCPRLGLAAATSVHPAGQVGQRQRQQQPPQPPAGPPRSTTPGAARPRPAPENPAVACRRPAWGAARGGCPRPTPRPRRAPAARSPSERDRLALHGVSGLRHAGPVLRVAPLPGHAGGHHAVVVTSGTGSSPGSSAGPAGAGGGGARRLRCRR